MALIIVVRDGDAVRLVSEIPYESKSEALEAVSAALAADALAPEGLLLVDLERAVPVVVLTRESRSSGPAATPAEETLEVSEVTSPEELEYLPDSEPFELEEPEAPALDELPEVETDELSSPVEVPAVDLPTVGLPDLALAEALLELDVTGASDTPDPPELDEEPATPSVFDESPEPVVPEELPEPATSNELLDVGDPDEAPEAVAQEPPVEPPVPAWPWEAEERTHAEPVLEVEMDPEEDSEAGEELRDDTEVQLETSADDGRDEAKPKRARPKRAMSARKTRNPKSRVTDEETLAEDAHPATDEEAAVVEEAAVIVAAEAVVVAVESEPEDTAGYEPSEYDLSELECTDCVYVNTCPNKEERTPATCGSFQWTSV